MIKVKNSEVKILYVLKAGDLASLDSLYKTVLHKSIKLSNFALLCKWSAEHRRRGKLLIKQRTETKRNFFACIGVYKIFNDFDNDIANVTFPFEILML